MAIIFSVLIGGILLGYLLRKKNIKFISKIITIIIWALLFFLGMEVGSNPDVISNLGSLGLTSLIIAIASLLGSLLFSWLLWNER